MFNGSRLALARKRRHLTKKELAEKAGLTALTLTRLESGETSEPAADTIRGIATALKYPFDFFYLGDTEPLLPDAVSFRSLSTLSARKREAALAAGELAFELHKWVCQRFDLPPCAVPDLRDEDPVTASESVRANWGIGARPIGALLRLLESKGVRVFCLDEQHKHVDAFSCWREDVPYIFLNTFKSPERSRFDAAHELGHLVMHRHGSVSGRDVERDADQFAAAFLMPRGDVIGHLGKVNSLEGLVKAKQRWGVSVAALARTAFDLKLISDWHYRELCRQLSSAGYRSAEPMSIQRERSALWKMIFDTLWKEGISKHTVEAELHLPLDEIECLIGELIAPSIAEVHVNGARGLELVS